MTVGISLTNGLEAIIITDSQGTARGRESNSSKKVKCFNNDNYNGVLFTAGSGNHGSYVLKCLDEIPDELFEDYVEAVKMKVRLLIDSYDSETIEAYKREVEKKAKLVTDEEERKGFIHQETSKKMIEFDQYKNNPNNTSSFIAVAYDKKSGKIRSFHLNSEVKSELFYPNVEIGSGNDGASLYFMTKLQGVDIEKMNISELVFFAMNAYSISTIYEGVSGTPSLAVINKEGVDNISKDKRVALSNLSCAYLSEFSRDLTPEATIKYVERILTGEESVYEELSKVLKTGKDALTSTYITYNSWQERSNSNLFSK